MISLSIWSKRDMDILFYLCIFISVIRPSYSLTPNENHVCAVQATRARATEVGGSWWRRSTTEYRLYYVTEYHCCTGWRSKNGASCDFAICNGQTDPEACTNYYADNFVKERRYVYSPDIYLHDSGGSCSAPEVCESCNHGFYSTGPECEVCTQIAHCNIESCRTNADQMCSWCEGEVVDVPGQRAYVHTSNRRQCIQACSWRADSTPCYPGTCPMEYAANCQCHPGFGDNLCRTILDYPSTLYHLVVLHDDRGTTIETPSNNASTGPQPTKWTNNGFVHTIEFEYRFNYQTSGTIPAKPYYVSKFAAGMTFGEATVIHERDGNQTVFVSSSTVPCSNPADRDQPYNKSPYVCHHTLPLQLDDIEIMPDTAPPVRSTVRSHNFISADRIIITYTVQNGGHIDIKDMEASAAEPNKPRQYYNGKTVTQTFDYTFDFDDPYHCIDTGCLENMLNTPEATTSTTITISWDGWLDSLAGVFHYEVEIFQLCATGDILTECGGPIFHMSILEPQRRVVVDSPGPAFYSVILATFDEAGNHRLARRVFISDNVSMVTVMPNTYLRVSSSAPITDYTWQQVLAPIEVIWSGRYTNARHHANKWLHSIDVHHGLDPAYDDIVGRSNTSAVDNVLGVVQFQYVLRKDHYGGSSITDDPLDSDYLIAMDLFGQTQTVDAGVVDGDSIRFWLRAFDLRHEYLQEQILLHIDSSPPIIEDLWLTRGDRLNLSVHNIEDLQHMTLEWQTFDIHSGLYNVYWRLFDNFTGIDILHGHEHIVTQGHTQNLTECESKYQNTGRGHNCYCTPMSGCFHQSFQLRPQITPGDSGLFYDKSRGTHDHDYFFMVNVTNNALLWTMNTIKITIDVSAPHVGVVHEGVRGSPDADYQNTNVIRAHWEGFFDRESGVKFYQYAFATTCLSAQDFSTNQSETIVETYSTYATWHTPSTGKYYVTVVAFNAAIEPSVPVCSDGIVYDVTPPYIGEVGMMNLVVRPGLIKDVNDHVWYMERNRTIVPIFEPSMDCIGNATVTSDIDLYPRGNHRFLNGTIMSTLNNEFCHDALPAITTMSILIKDSYVELWWRSGDDESTVFDTEIGFSSSSDGLSADLMPFTTAHHHHQYRGYHSQIGEGMVFYVVFKVTNKANLATTKVLGPILVDLTKPDFSGSLETTFDSGYLVTRWDDGAFSDANDAFPLEYEVFIGHTHGVADVLLPSKLMFIGPCVGSIPPTCTAVSNTDLDWKLHGHHEYYVTIRAENTAGLSTLATSGPYVHDIQLPMRGLVFDMAPPAESNDEFGIPVEVDFQESLSSLGCYWFGFAHPHLSIAYFVGIGTDAGAFDVLPLTPSQSENKHVENSLSLDAFQAYYCTVVAVSEAGNVSVTSDGITVINPNTITILTNVTIRDGLGCDDASMNMTDVSHSHHQKQPHEHCTEDLDFQASLSSLSGWWNIPETVKHLITDVYYAIEEKSTLGDFWSDFRDYEPARSGEVVRMQDVLLLPGVSYRLSVKFCSAHICYPAKRSDGVTVLPHPPRSGSLAIDYQDAGNTSSMSVTIAKFYDPDLSNGIKSRDAVNRYEWTLTDGSADGALLHQWTAVESMNSINGTHAWFLVLLPMSLKFNKCTRFAIRGYNRAGLWTITSSDIKHCPAFDPRNIIPNVVIDASGEPDDLPNHGRSIFMDLNAHWRHKDVDFTPNINVLSAAWPTLRHQNYSWAVIYDNAMDAITHYKHPGELKLADPCSHPTAIACGNTAQEFINVYFDDSPLLEGHRYYVCISAESTTLEHEKWPEDLPAIRACSDGVTVDISAPTAAEVWIGPRPGVAYQTSISELFVNWNSFLDVEEFGFSPLHSGIKSYHVFIGTTAGAHDIVDVTNVGVTNYVVFNNLRLQNGYRYYATVEGTDFVGKTSSAISSPIKIDLTPPETSENGIDFAGRRHISNNGFGACWHGVFLDHESGIDGYNWALGTRPGSDDVIDFTISDQQCIHIEGNSADLLEGHAYYFSVKAYNGAGLSSLVTSWALVVDDSPPSTGEVYDGSPDADAKHQKDADYQTDLSYLAASWRGFYDPHTTIRDYIVAIGTYQGGEDVVRQHSVGIVTDIKFNKIPLASGLTYYTTVTSCNTADLCTTVTSDGITLDDTPPVAGIAWDGTESTDIQYQASRTSFGARWHGFHDPHSGLLMYEWRAGSSPGGSDIHPVTRLHLTEKVFVSSLPVGQELPVGTRIYISVRAYNRAGLFSEATSNGFTVDSSAPVIVLVPSLDRRLGSLVPDTNAMTTLLRVSWEFQDQQSHIQRQYISLSSHVGGDFNVSSIQIPGFLTEYTLTDLLLHDGGSYYVTIVACNFAKLCTKSVSRDILIDGSQPNPGMFAIETDHAVNLDRHLDGWMTWTSTTVSLAWLGFADLHSGIDHYMITIGDSFFSRNLLLITDPVRVSHVSGVGDLDDEGHVQTNTISTQTLNAGDTIYVAMWAVNGVGLESIIIHSQLDLVLGGGLELVRRCVATTCEGHCICAPQNMKCPAAPQSCNGVSLGNSNDLISIFDVTNLQFDSNIADEDFTPSNSLLAARWEVNTEQGKSVRRYEWSAGFESDDLPTGIFTALERNWFDAGQKTNAVLSLPKDKFLVEKLVYSFFVRAWYDDNTYAVFKSDGITVLAQPPKTTIIRGASIREMQSTSDDVDRDAFSHGNSAIVRWNDIFLQSVYMKQFEILLSAYQGGTDMLQSFTTADGSTTSATLSNLNIPPNTYHYNTVLGRSRSGLVAIESSDGFIIDVEPPSSGVVVDGADLHDARYQSRSDLLSASWHGFSDAGSGIVSYEWCVGRTSTPDECGIHPLENVGLKTSVHKVVGHNLATGVILYHKVVAIDGVGFQSINAVSDGIIIDATPPEASQRFVYGSNMIVNPSFENDPDNANTKWSNVTDMKSICAENRIILSWDTHGEGCSILIKPHPGDSRDGSNVVMVYGTIEQAVNGLILGEKYKVKFYASHMTTTKQSNLHQEGVMSIDGNKHAFVLSPRVTLAESAHTSWQRYLFYFTASEANTILALGSSGLRSPILIDDVSLQHCGQGNRISSHPTAVQQTSHVDIQAVIMDEWSSVHATWDFIDNEDSEITYEWAIGYTFGGVQVQDFKAVGFNSIGISQSLQLRHNSAIMVTVLATNSAGLRTVSYSDPVTVDFTPPIIDVLHDGPNIDIDVQSSTTISANWHVYDSETGIDFCEWRIGYNDMSFDISEYHKLQPNTFSMNHDVGSILQHGDTVFVTVRCWNNMGLFAMATTDGVTMVLDLPSSVEAYIETLESPKTEFLPRESFHNDNHRVKICWKGVTDTAGIDSYKISLTGNNVDHHSVLTYDYARMQCSVFSNIRLSEDESYTVSSEAVNVLGLTAAPVNSSFTVILTRPSLSFRGMLTQLWDTLNNEVTVSWANLFVSATDLHYEVSVGTIEGAADVIFWQETRDTELVIDVPDDWNLKEPLSVTVSAINDVGLCVTHSSFVYLVSF